MKIQPVNTNQCAYQTGFQAKKLPNLKVKPRVKKQLTSEQEQNRNYGQAILFALAFCAAAFTKYFIDAFNARHNTPVAAEVRSEQFAGSTNTNIYQLK